MVIEGPCLGGPLNGQLQAGNAVIECFDNDEPPLTAAWPTDLLPMPKHHWYRPQEVVVPSPSEGEWLEGCVWLYEDLWESRLGIVKGLLKMLAALPLGRWRLHACHWCGPTEEALRPYGPGGATVCHDCTFDPAHPERARHAEEAFRALVEANTALGSGMVVTTEDGRRYRAVAIGTEEGPHPLRPGDLRVKRKPISELRFEPGPEPDLVLPDGPPPPRPKSVEEQRDAVVARLVALESLLAFYRLGRRPTEKLHKELGRTRKAVIEAFGEYPA